MKSSNVITSIVLLLLAGVSSFPAVADDNLPAGFKPHVCDVAGGHVDWANGYIISVGTGLATGEGAQSKAQAERAAELVAARNALAIALGIQVDGNGALSGIANGQVHIDGVIKHHKVMDVTWRQKNKLRECVMKMKVPLWGAQGVADMVYAKACNQAKRQGGRRMKMADAAGEVSEEVLVIDTRGLKLCPCLFGQVVSSDGSVLYDIDTCRGIQASHVGPIRYVETDMSIEDLQSSLDNNSEIYAGLGESPSLDEGAAFEPAATRQMAWFDPLPDEFEQNSGTTLLFPTDPPIATQPASTQPASQPAGSKRRARLAVKAVKTTGTTKATQIVLTKEDAEKLSKSREGATLMQDGKVIVVVDSEAAGIHGRHDTNTDPDALASLNRR